MGKVLVQLAASSHPRQVDVPADAERSVEGALHFRPGSAKWITAAELAHIQATEPDLAGKLRVLAEDGTDEPKAKAAVPASKVPKAPESKPEPSEPKSDEGGKTKPASRKGRRDRDTD